MKENLPYDFAWVIAANNFLLPQCVSNDLKTVFSTTKPDVIKFVLGTISLSQMCKRGFHCMMNFEIE
jgi:hypothetical protein